jgi:L-threonylcarbamoyladenylate synthase
MTEAIAIDRNTPDDSVLQHAADVVRSGGLIVYPTETLYGIGADASDPAAIRKVHEAKGRTERKPILVIVDSVEMMLPYVETVSLAARILMEKLWPGPLTLVFKASGLVSSELVQNTGTIGIRIPSSRLCLRLLAHLRVPLTSTSANSSGEKPLRTIKKIQGRLTGIDLYLDAGELPESQPSTIVDVSGDIPRVLRGGAVTTESIKQVLLEIQS